MDRMAIPPFSKLSAIFDQISAVGADVGRGVTRLAASPEDERARSIFESWMSKGGARVAQDQIGNQFACFDWAGAKAPWIFSGSHLDTQQCGGRFDGTLGVLAAGCVGLELNIEVNAGSLAPTHNFAVVNWTNEEGARFRPSLTGSSVYAGTLPLSQAFGLRDDVGVTLQAALAATGIGGAKGRVPQRPEAFVELHVEQGRQLLDINRRIGVVESTWAAHKITGRWTGRAAHTGPTAMKERCDALLAAAKGIAAFESLITSTNPNLHHSAARIVVHPNSPNVVPETATVWFEIRGTDVVELESLRDAAICVFDEIAKITNTRFETVSSSTRRPAYLDKRLAKMVAEASRSRNLVPTTLRSVAGHDSVALQNSGIPSALIFVPSADGIAHHPDEFTKLEDMRAGLAVLSTTIRRLVVGGIDGT